MLLAELMLKLLELGVSLVELIFKLHNLGLEEIGLDASAKVQIVGSLTVRR